MQKITILGSTGSIGTSTLNVLSRYPDKYAVYALTAHTRIDQLAERFEDSLLRDILVVLMCIIEIDPIGAETLERGFGRGGDARGRELLATFAG